MTQISPTSLPPRHRPDRLTLAGLGVVALAAAATSFSTLADLARDAGWSRDVAPALPVIIDVMALVSTRTWLSGPAGVRALARRTALLCILASVAGNAVAHLIAAGVIRPSVALVIVVAMVPPVGLGVVAHLAAALAATPVAAVQAAVVPTLVSAPAEVAPSALVATEPDSEADTATDIPADTAPPPKRPARRVDTAAQVAKLRTKHPDASAAELARRLGVSDRTVRRHLSALAAA